MQTTIAFVLLFSLWAISLGADVTVYDANDYFSAKLPKVVPVAVSQFPWKFSYFGLDIYDTYMYIVINNKSPSMTAINVTCQSDDRTFEIKKNIQSYGPRKGEEHYAIMIIRNFLAFTEMKIKLNFCTSNILCSSLLIAEGKEITKIRNKILTNELSYVFHGNTTFVLVVDLVNKCVDADNTNYTFIIIAVISSISGTLLIQLAVIAVCKRCWIKRDPSGTPQLLINQRNTDPFYLNMLFRRQCDQEIAELDQHQYEEIVPRVAEGN